MKTFKEVNFNEEWFARMNRKFKNVNHVAPSVNKNFEETETSNAYTINANAMGYTWHEDDMPERIYKSFVSAIATYLGKVKVSKEDQAVALVLTDVNGVFRFAGIVEYHENEEDKDKPGNWSFILTFREEDLDNVCKRREVKKLSFGDDAFKNILDKVGYDIGSISFDHTRYMYDACLLCVDTLIGILDKEAKEDEVVDIDMPGYFTASVEVENGVKIFSIVPDGSMKELIKGDIDLNR